MNDVVPAERRSETLARMVVSHVLELEVRRHDDGRRPSLVDAQIMFPSCPAGMEVVSDESPDERRQSAALDKFGRVLDVPGLTHDWLVWLRRTADVRRVRLKLPGLLRQVERGDLIIRKPSVVPDEFTGIGIFRIVESRLSESDSPQVRLMTEPWSGSAEDESLDRWLRKMFEQHADVPRKLAAHPTEHGHAFLWIGMRTENSVQLALENRGQGLPGTNPELPQGVTHLWVASPFSSQGVLAWFPDRGWWRTPWRWPERPEHLPSHSP
ncbi:hypothetical protein [Jiangella endophytica]|uniref:hypothetical protein n=1 Tax=Jiangella endophytica TaxID=1623398 RepID=UPI0013009720|nr:hypothetical protein [Jiangella endophytica]